jgi:hypothetical protein
MLRDHTTPICPLPGLGQCVRERCNFWDEEKEECAAEGDETGEPIDATFKPDLETPCVIAFYEDDD